MTEYNNIIQEIEKINPNVILIEGYNHCILGICETFEGVRLLYSKKKIINTLASKMSMEDAIEYYYLNILGLFSTIDGPIFLVDLAD